MNLDAWLAYSVRRACLDRDLETVRGSMTGDVLEIGNGRSGRRGRFAPPIVAGHWTFVDLDVLRAPDILADARSLPFRSESYDTVVALEMLEYVDDPPGVVNEMGRVLRPEGQLILSVPFLHRADTDHDFWRMTEPGLRRLLAQAGFVVVSVKAQGHALAVVINILKHAVAVRRRGIGRRLLGQGLRLLAALLLRLDEPVARHLPTLATFSTGYLVLARLTPPAPMSGR